MAQIVKAHTRKTKTGKTVSVRPHARRDIKPPEQFRTDFVQDLAWASGSIELQDPKRALDLVKKLQKRTNDKLIRTKLAEAEYFLKKKDELNASEALVKLSNELLIARRW